MNCSLCNAETTRKTGDHLCESNIIGDVLVPLVEVETCSSCGALQLSTESERKVADYLKMLEKNAIISLPADNLISAGQAAGILGISKQAFSKNPKIKKGFVYFTYVGTKKVYFRSSVELFKRSGDGRFPIIQWRSSVPSDRISHHAANDDFWQQVSCQTDKADCAVFTWSKSL
ncbi:MAG: hypothetical protein HKP41_14430 [Desulfobacterales bacterium]|nr:hypothetical protein [Desulfobacterales bacterium]